MTFKDALFKEIKISLRQLIQPFNASFMIQKASGSFSHMGMFTVTLLPQSSRLTPLSRLNNVSISHLRSFSVRFENSWNLIFQDVCKRRHLLVKHPECSAERVDSIAQFYTVESSKHVCNCTSAYFVPYYSTNHNVVLPSYEAILSYVAHWKFY